MGTSHSYQTIQNNMKGHEQTNYQKNSSNFKLNFQVCHPYQLGVEKGLKAFVEIKHL